MIFKYSRKENVIKRVATIGYSAQSLYFIGEFLYLLSNQGLIEVSLTNYEVTIETLFESPAVIVSSTISESGKIVFSTLSITSPLTLIDIGSKKITTKLPQFKKPITKMRFINSNEIALFDSINSFFVYNINTLSFNPISIKGEPNVPKNLSSWYNKVLGIAVISPKFLIAYTDYNFIPIYLDAKVPETAIIERDLLSRSKAKSIETNQSGFHTSILNKVKQLSVIRSEETDTEEVNETSNFKIMTKFISNIFMEYVDQSIIVVEVDWSNILEHMPNPIVKHRFGK